MTAPKKAPSSTATKKAAAKATTKKVSTTAVANKAAGKTASSHTAKAKSPKGTEKAAAKNSGFSAAEKAAMRERAAESRAAAKRKGASGAAADAADCIAKITALPEPDRTLASGIHELIQKAAPHLAPKLWYGMPAYARDGKVVCFIQPASKFKTRYLTLGFSDQARLDTGSMWATVYAVTAWSKSTQTEVAALIRKAEGL